MTKLQDAYEAMKNPPPERLARIEYRNQFYLIGAYVFAGTFLIYHGFWYIIPIFLFSSFISYAQGMTSYKKYQVIKQFVPEEKPEEFENEISPTRKRSKIINYVYGRHVSWGLAGTSVVLALFVIDPTQSRWMLMLLYPFVMLSTYFALYFGIMYWIALPIYRSKMKNEKGGKNGKSKR
ncbi:hypothetical protein LCGC14_1536570 [marine sediment metagenome]|uniref:Uncharacterized protein n=1 Tax=marine sediment metagenome TaxID=412755 RepID=A0A0F9JF86_9ZZZZ